MTVTDERLSPRARAYLGIAAARSLALALVCILLPDTFSSPSYGGVKGALTPFGLSPGDAIIAWGFLFGLSGILCVVAAVRGREGAARSALLACVLTSGVWIGGFLASAQAGTLAGLTGPIVWTALCLKDATMLRNPLKNPFERVVNRVLATPK